ncbi:hypothetical protein BKA82DRAFT_11211 [Pisolithus tinctorius]|uniref:Uncharacterized protein n=1 Tax=Pisolithus tinctorius Marx 270 TaxID=870435 RepID=A0A0C3ID44_PISTI|nr:hypothetical protein BKA82DRAFT_11211 [Pisolithus tinctorius]KIN94957.1 hypothetical protein M404DRAFT_11211 [Pisolithus tinctorius Marx 270]
MVKIMEISMIMAAISSQGIDLNDKIKALILVHSMSQAWDQAPINILSSITANQLGPDTVIPRMKEVWSHKSGKTLLPKQEPASTSGACIILKIITEEVLLVVVDLEEVMEVFTMDVEVLLLTHNNSSKVLPNLMGIRTKTIVVAKARVKPEPMPLK